MLKKILYTSLLTVFSLFMFVPYVNAQEESIPEEDLMFYTTIDDEVVAPEDEMLYTTDDESETYNYEDYDWETAWESINSNTDGYSNLTEEESTALGLLTVIFGGAFMVVALVVGLVCYIYNSLTLMVTAKKLNVPNAWLAWVPLVNLVTLVQTAGQSLWGVLVILIPFVNIFYGIYLYMEIARRRGFQNWLGVLIIVPIANIVLMGYLAWAEPKSNAKAAEAVVA